MNYLNQTDNANFLFSNRNISAETGVRFTWSLYDGGLAKIEKQTARLRADKAQQRRKSLLEQLENELSRAYAIYENSQQQLAFELAQLPVFTLNFTQTEREFNTGIADGTTLRAAQLTLDAAKKPGRGGAPEQIAGRDRVTAVDGAIGRLRLCSTIRHIQ